tara:strand:- start:8334 stop:10193 length:1860 start_codon:yes stop_codon:yes gene_type:complete
MLEYITNKKIVLSGILLLICTIAIGPLLTQIIEAFFPIFFQSKMVTWFTFIYSFYEASMRLSFITFFLLITAWFLFTAKIRELEIRQKMVATAFMVAFGIVGTVLMIDTNLFYIEESLIAPFTTLVFFFAGIMALYAAFRNKGKRVMLFWMIFTVLAFLAGLDEILTLHEIAGTTIEQTFGIAHAFTDLITLSVATGLLVVIYLLYRQFKEEISGPNKLMLKTLVASAVFFFVAMGFDTFDFIFEIAARTLAEFASTLSPGLVFPPALFIFYNPHILLNSIEELFEFLGAILLAISFLFGILEMNNFQFLKRIEKRPIKSVAFSETRLNYSLIILAVLSVLLFIVTPTAIVKNSEYQTTVVLGPSQGLLHADDLFFDGEIGLVIGNEGRAEVIVFKDGQSRTLSFPELKDTDSVTVHENRIFVSDSKSGKVFEIEEEAIKVKVESSENSFLVPEGIVFDEEGGLLVLDESLNRIVRVKDGLREIIASEEDGILAPEGIAIGLDGSIFVTDDKQGKIFRLNGEVTTIASRKDGLVNPEGITVGSKGSIFVTDNGARAIFRIRDGKVEKVISFSDNYGDLQGIAIKDGNEIYVITSDGYGSQSFMPSFLIKITSIGGVEFE